MSTKTLLKATAFMFAVGTIILGTTLFSARGYRAEAGQGFQPRDLPANCGYVRAIAATDAYLHDARIYIVCVTPNGDKLFVGAP